jgi:hypothetical protein
MDRALNLSLVVSIIRSNEQIDESYEALMIIADAHILLSGPENSFFDSWWIRFPLLTLIVACGAIIVLFFMLAFRPPIVRYLGGGVLPVHLWLPALGSVALVVLFVELVNEGYVLVLPGIILGVLSVLVLSSKKGSATTTLIEFVESSGVIFVAWLLSRGWMQTFSDWRTFLSIRGETYGAWALVAILGAMAGFCVVVHVLAQRKHDRDYSAWMQNSSYRKMQEQKWKIQEEKWQVERKVREIEEMQEYFVQHGMKW